MKATILIVWLHSATMVGGIHSTAFPSPEACNAALAAVKAEDWIMNGVCVPQGVK